MKPTIVHPDQHALALFMRSKLPRSETSVIVRHLLAGCPRCSEVTRRLWKFGNRTAELAVDETGESDPNILSFRRKGELLQPEDGTAGVELLKSREGARGYAVEKPRLPKIWRRLFASAATLAAALIRRGGAPRCGGRAGRVRLQVREEAAHLWTGAEVEPHTDCHREPRQHSELQVSRFSLFRPSIDVEGAVLAQPDSWGLHITWAAPLSPIIGLANCSISVDLIHG